MRRIGLHVAIIVTAVCLEATVPGRVVAQTRSIVGIWTFGSDRGNFQNTPSFSTFYRFNANGTFQQQMVVSGGGASATEYGHYRLVPEDGQLVLVMRYEGHQPASYPSPYIVGANYGGIVGDSTIVIQDANGPLVLIRAR